MAVPFQCYVRRIDFEPKTDFLESRIYAHVFLKSLDGQEEVDVYTDNPRFEAAFLSAFSSTQVTQPPNPTRYIEVYYDVVNKTNRVIRITLDKDFTYGQEEGVAASGSRVRIRKRRQGASRR